MTHVKAALGETRHRPWPLPEEPWLVSLRWVDRLFAHWRVPAAALRRVVPPQLELEAEDGDAWLGVVACEISRVRLRGTVPVPGFSSFPELDLRTYVTAGGRPGIYHLSLDAPLWTVVRAAQRKYGLPYFHSRVERRERGDGWIEFSSERRPGPRPPAAFAARYRPLGGRLRLAPDATARRLAERYCVYSVDAAGRVLRGELHQLPSDLRAARAEIARNTVAEPFGLPLTGEPLLNFSPRQGAVLWPFRPLAAGD